MDDSIKEIIGVSHVSLGLKKERCFKCNKLLGYIDGRYEIKCPRCGEMNTNKKESVENDI